MNLFDFRDYKEFVNRRISSLPRRGRGEYGRMAQHLRITSVAISQIFRGERDLSLEQALSLTQHLHLSERESHYFLLLVQEARAGTSELRRFFAQQIEQEQEENQVVAKRVVEARSLSESAKAIFYSNWYYSAVRILSAIPGYQTRDKLAARLDLPPERINEVVEFLLREGLCVPTADGAGIQAGPASTHLEQSSPFIAGVRRHWRLKGLEHIDHLSKRDLFYSSLVAVSRSDFQALRKEFVEMITRFSQTVHDSPCESLAVINLDWFEWR